MLKKSNTSDRTTGCIERYSNSIRRLFSRWNALIEKATSLVSINFFLAVSLLSSAIALLSLSGSRFSIRRMFFFITSTFFLLVLAFHQIRWRLSRGSKKKMRSLNSIENKETIKRPSLNYYSYRFWLPGSSIRHAQVARGCKLICMYGFRENIQTSIIEIAESRAGFEILTTCVWANRGNSSFFFFTKKTLFSLFTRKVIHTLMN